jgi:hypothetical protein
MLGNLNNLSSQLENQVQKSNSLIKDGIFQDDYADFKEFEDENGTILLIKYDTKEYEFRGNKYCTYTLCNEKTGSREEGIAQIKNGQHVHIKDVDRAEKIKSYINEEKRKSANLKSLILKLKEKGVLANLDSDTDITNNITSKSEYNGDTYWLFIRNKFITEEHNYVVFNKSRCEIVEDIALINKLFDLSKYFPEENKPTISAKKPWWKKW